MWDDGDTPVPASTTEGSDEVERPVQPGQEGGIFWVRLPVIFVTLGEALCNVLIGHIDRFANFSLPCIGILRRSLGTAIHPRDGVHITVLHRPAVLLGI